MNGFTELINSLKGCLKGCLAPTLSFEKIKQEIKNDYNSETEMSRSEIGDYDSKDINK